jgi:membrane protease subunit (stomatin/prohibitin family)
MYNEQLEKLIEMALMDGELTEKEKQILFKKAESMGVDLDEFEMVLEAKLFEKQQSAKQQVAPPVSTTVAPKSDKYGDVKKCPSCGAIVQSFSGKCGDCGYEFRDIQSDVTITKLFEALMDADNLPKEEFRELSNNTGGGIMGSFMGSTMAMANRQKDEDRLKQLDKAHKEKIHARKVQIISNFPVPNTKEPLLEFLTLGISKATPIKKGIFSKMTAAEDEHNALVSAWKSKIDQVVMKAKMSMKEDKSLLSDIENMVAQLNSKK